MILSGHFSGANCKCSAAILVSGYLQVQSNFQKLQLIQLPEWSFTMPAATSRNRLTFRECSKNQASRSKQSGESYAQHSSI